MDMRKDGWHAQLQISGVTQSKQLQGSLISILGQIISELQETNPRTLANGKRITVVFGDKPMQDDQSESFVLKPIDGQGDGPYVGELPKEFLARLISQGCTEEIAKFYVADWFADSGFVQDSQTVRWMNDPKCARFSELQSSKAAYEQALPTEYESLKQYIIAEYPERAALITFKTA